MSFHKLEIKYYNACLAGDIDIIEYLVKYEFDQIKTWLFLSECLNNACKGGHINAVKMMFELTGNEKCCYHGILHNALIGENVDVLEFVTNIFIGRGNHYWCDYLTIVCEVGRMDIFIKCIDQVIDHILGTTIGLIYSSVSTETELWDKFLIYSCRSTNISLVKYFINKGATRLNECMHRASSDNNVQIVELCISKGATNYDCLKNSDNFQIYCLYCRHTGNVDDDKYLKLLLKYPQYILFIGSRARTPVKSSARSIKKLPVELFRLMFSF